jgi:hypothetical protein
MPQGRFRKPRDQDGRLINPAPFDKSKSQRAGATFFGEAGTRPGSAHRRTTVSSFGQNKSPANWPGFV